MVAALNISDGVTAIFKHDTNPGNAIGDIGVNGAASIGNPADNRHPVTNSVARDPHGGIDDRALCAAIIARAGAVHRGAGTRIRAHFGNIGNRSRSPANQRRHRNTKLATIAGDGRCNQDRINSNRIGSQSHLRRQNVSYRYWPSAA